MEPALPASQQGSLLPSLTRDFVWKNHSLLGSGSLSFAFRAPFLLGEHQEKSINWLWKPRGSRFLRRAISAGCSWTPSNVEMDGLCFKQRGNEWSSLDPLQPAPGCPRPWHRGEGAKAQRYPQDRPLLLGTLALCQDPRPSPRPTRLLGWSRPAPAGTWHLQPAGFPLATEPCSDSSRCRIDQRLPKSRL